MTASGNIRRAFTPPETLRGSPEPGQDGPSEATRAHLWKQCNEDVLIVHVDPERLKGIVAPEFKILMEHGKARILIAVQDCSSYRLEGEEVGPTQEVHEWVAIEMPPDVRPVPGAERTLPTMHWFALFTGSNNERSREHWNRSGTEALPLETVTLGSSASAVRGNMVIEGNRGYEWRAEPGAPFARLVAVNHDVYARSPAGEIVLNRIQCLATVEAWGSRGELEVTEAADPSGILSEGTHVLTAHTFLPLWGWATLADGSLGGQLGVHSKPKKTQKPEGGPYLRDLMGTVPPPQKPVIGNR